MGIFVTVLCAHVLTGEPTPPAAPQSGAPEAPESESDTHADAAPRDELTIGAQLTILDQLSGHYRFRGGAKDRRALERAVERSASEVVFLFRGFARRRMLEANQIPQNLALAREGGRIHLKFGKLIRKATLTADWNKWTDEFGDKVDLRYRIRGKKLVETIKGDGGQRRNTYTLSPDRKNLLIRVEITSKRLPTPLRYDLHYQRTPAVRATQAGR